MKTAQLRHQAEELNQTLTELVRRYQFRNRNEICCFDISVSQCHVMESLDRHGALLLGALAKQMYLDISTTSRLTDQLEKRGYVRRVDHPVDRRAWLIDLTTEGKRLLKRIQAMAIQKEMEVLNQIPAASRRDVVLALKLLVKAVDSWRQSLCCVPNKLRTIKH